MINIQRTNLWDMHEKGFPIAITTNGVILGDGKNVMGGGIALQAAERFPNLPRELGANLDKYGNKTFFWKHYNLITLPTKNHWRNPSDINLIRDSLESLFDLFSNPSDIDGARIYAPLLGCGLGGLKWEDVSKGIWDIYEKFDGRLIFCDNS